MGLPRELGFGGLTLRANAGIRARASNGRAAHSWLSWIRTRPRCSPGPQSRGQRVTKPR